MRSPNKSRSRNKNNNRRNQAGNVINRVFDSNGPEGKVRGTPNQIIEKYMTLARDAQLSGDRVAAENFAQHGEHYARLLNEAQAEIAEEQARRQAEYDARKKQRALEMQDAENHEADEQSGSDLVETPEDSSSDETEKAPRKRGRAPNGAGAEAKSKSKPKAKTEKPAKSDETSGDAATGFGEDMPGFLAASSD